MRIVLITLALVLNNSTTFRLNEERFLNYAVNDYLSDIENYVIEGKNETLSRIVIDLNQDGLNDILLTGYYKGAWGNAGGEWVIYYQTKGDSIKKCENTLFIDPAIAFYNPTNREILIYTKYNCCEGSVNYINISDCNFKLSRSIQLEENSGDQIGQQLDSIILKNPKFKRFKVQNSILKDFKKLDWK